MGNKNRPPLLCFSHLRWDFVWQRPQQLMSRFARDRQVFFIEEPVFQPEADAAPGGATVELSEADGVTVVRPVCREPMPEEGRRLETMYAQLTAELVSGQGLTEPTAWFYSPMFLPALDKIAPGLIVYDAMDELSLFRDAPAALQRREHGLLGLADVVFTGGVSLGKAKARHHANVHAFASGVEVEHYCRALQGETRVPPDLADLPRPRAGYFGVIDERLDLPLLDGLAAARPDVQFVLLGPVVKIDPASLPVRPNLHYLGQKAYRDLPSYVKGFDVCLMPFALNDATRFISPTKTLEYMAAHKPIVSTPVADVVSQYGTVVQIASDVAAFSTAISIALGETPAKRASRIIKEQGILARSTWDAIATRMDDLMRQGRDATVYSRSSSPRAVTELDDVAG
ncbi:MAG: glycosyltransferase [Chloroflexota bacterium]|nr:glycosyltransferase [Chloroflexota bacterium]